MADKMHDVFLSYSHNDINKAEKLFEQLCNAGISVWIDKHTLNMGDYWREHIRRGIESSIFFLPLLSSAAFAPDSYARQELREALEIIERHPARFLKILPIRLEDCKSPSPELEQIHQIDLFLEEAWNEGFSRLMKVFLDQKKVTQNLEIVGFDIGHGETAVASTRLHTTAEPRVLEIANGRFSILTTVAITPNRGVVIGDDAYEAEGANALHILFKDRKIREPAVSEPLHIFVQKCLELLKDQGKIRLDDATYFIVGRPSGWTEAEARNYENLLKSAGMMNVSVQPESRLASISLALPPREAGAAGTIRRV